MSEKFLNGLRSSKADPEIDNGNYVLRLKIFQKRAIPGIVCDHFGYGSKWYRLCGVLSFERYYGERGKEKRLCVFYSCGIAVSCSRRTLSGKVN